MMERTAPHISGDDSLQLLAHFSQELDQITELPSLAERILEEFCRATRQSAGSLYLLTESTQRFNRLAIQGSMDNDVFPSIIRHDDPLIQQVPLLQQTLGCSLHKRRTSLGIQRRVQPSTLDCPANNIILPLFCRDRLLAFVMFRPWANPPSPNLSQMEILPVMASIAAHSLNSILFHELQRQADTLLRGTNQLHIIEYLADSVAHAIRNPLTSIKTFIQLVGEGRNDPQFISNFSQMALDDVRRLEQLTQETFDYIRYRQPNPTEEDINDIVSSCLYFLEFTIRHRRIKIEKDLAPEPPRGMVDKQHIQQTLFSVLVNAVEALGPHGGTVRIRTGHLMKSNGTAWSHIDIEDTGQGIPLENLGRIFDPFFTTKHQAGKPKRSGLGLTIAQQIIDAHRGEIHVQSTEGVGTTCSIYLPLCTV